LEVAGAISQERVKQARVEQRLAYSEALKREYQDLSMRGLGRRIIPSLVFAPEVEITEVLTFVVIAD